MATKQQMTRGERGGFTIIEVVLVLAIAGLIFLMVFIALPTLQRSQRDTERRNALGRVSSQITQYQTNNNGKLPGEGVLEPTEEIGLPDCSRTNPDPAACFVRNYMNGVGATENEFVDPDGWAYGLTIAPLTRGTESMLVDFDHIVYIFTHAACNGENVVYSSNSRDYAIQYKLEGAGTYCADNGGSAAGAAAGEGGEAAGGEATE